ncbi:acyltransferase family protein [Celerinatantimonas yamalensis]|uniref:Acyltransferase family protein n=1 Tax=Celerinatantimonas yamalensis TaxID=559956 RepID=A0ABW9G290_9GAMM
MNLNQFVLPYTDMYGPYLFISAVLLISILSLNKKGVVDASISINNSNFLKGLFILTVVLHHFFLKSVVHETIVDVVINKIYSSAGFLAVGIFFFLSGYGLSASRKNISLYNLLKIKLFRVYIPCLVVNLVVSILLHKNILQSFNPIAFDTTQWFIIAILFFYLFDFFAIKINIGILTINFFVIIWVIVCIKLDLGLWWYESSFCFPLGYIWQKHSSIITEFISRNTTKILTLLFIFFGVSFLIELRYPYETFLTAVIFSLFISLVVARFNPTNKIMNAIGKSSLEIYILHIKLAWIMIYIMNTFKITNSFSFIIYMVVLIISGMIFSKINNYILIKIKSRKLF